MFKTAMRRGEMREHMAGVSALQRVPFTINWRILDLLGHIERLGLLKVTSTNPRTRKRQQKNNYKRIRMALLDAVRLWRFWVPKNCDRRGRVYNGTHFSMDREDFVRALFLFADGEPIGEEGLRLLKVHLANCGDFDKISKRPFAERVAWVDANLDKIRACAANPLRSCGGGRPTRRSCFGTSGRHHPGMTGGFTRNRQGGAISIGSPSVIGVFRSPKREIVSAPMSRIRWTRRI